MYIQILDYVQWNLFSQKYICDYEIQQFQTYDQILHRFSCLRRIYLDVEINETERNKMYKENRKDHKSFTLLLKNAKLGYKEHE